MLVGTISLAAPPLSGAIFTTTVDGDVVNENVRYQKKEDVYLDGGPGPNAPSTAAGLPEGDYYFQVTDPSGKDLLSTDHISCRRIHVNANGVIDKVYAGTNYEKQKGQWTAVSCQHKEGVDQDHAELGAITVQLFPYDDTPNPGGVYKVWVTPVEDYDGKWGVNYVPSSGGKGIPVNGEHYAPGNYHGFIPAKSKTDNYKVKARGKTPTPAELTVRKFHDSNVNGVWDTGEAEITGWAIHIRDPLGVEQTEYTKVLVLAEPAGVWTIKEAALPATKQTVSIVDGVSSSKFPTANPTVLLKVNGDEGETHEVVFGNVGLGSIVACKVYDRDCDGKADANEPGVPGWQMQLTGTDVTGATYGPVVKTTGPDGCAKFGDLLPGTYTVKELMPTNGNWVATGSTSVDVTVKSSLDGTGSTAAPIKVAFTNYCTGTADFGTKGYWHNKNGLAEITTADINYANGLTPYATASSYFGAGDEPFDGEFSDGTDVQAAKGATGDLLASAGTALAEISSFLVDSNATGDAREQLAQQLLAFIFNARHRLDAIGALVKLKDGTMVGSDDLIADAIDAWKNGTDAERTAIKDVLDWLNNQDDIYFVYYNPCKVQY
ncbi:MAG: SdrD B-like domain-containing protein [Planctomycetota bacterium]